MNDELNFRDSDKIVDVPRQKRRSTVAFWVCAVIFILVAGWSGWLLDAITPLEPRSRVFFNSLPLLKEASADHATVVTSASDKTVDQSEWLVQVWDTFTGKELHRQHDGQVGLFEDGRYVLALTKQGRIHVLDRHEGTSWTRELHRRFLGFSRSFLGRYAVLYEWNESWFFDLATGKLAWKTPGKLTSLHVDAAGKSISYTVTPHLEWHHPGRIAACVAVQANCGQTGLGDIIHGAGWHTWPTDARLKPISILHRVDASGRESLSDLGAFEAVCFAADGSTVLLRNKGAYECWDLTDNRKQRLQTPADRELRAFGFHFSKDGKRLLCTNFPDGEGWALWDVTTGQRLQPELPRRKSSKAERPFSPDSNLFWYEGIGSIVVADAATGKAQWSRKFLSINRAFFSEDSRFFVVGGVRPDNKTVCEVMDAATGEVDAEFLGGAGITDNGRYVASIRQPAKERTFFGSTGTMAKVHDVATRRPLTVVALSKLDNLLSARLSEDGNTLTTTSGTAKRFRLECWDLTSRAPLFWRPILLASMSGLFALVWLAGRRKRRRPSRKTLDALD